MITKTKKQENKSKEKSVTFLCHHCKGIVKVFVENWNQNSDGPFMIELVHHEEMVAMVVDTIDIKESNHKPIFKFAYCGVCGNLLNAPVETEKLYLNPQNSTSGVKI